MQNYIKYENYIIPFSSIVLLNRTEHIRWDSRRAEIIVQYPLLKLHLKDGSSIDIPRDLKLMEEIQNNYIAWLESQSNQQPKF